MSTQQGDVEAIFHQAWPLPSIRGEVHREEAASRLAHAPANDSLIERHVDHRDDQSMQLQQTPLPRSPLPHSLPLPTQLVSVPQQPRPLENVQMTAQLLYSETDVVVGAMEDTCSQRTGAWTGNLELVKDEMAYGHLGQHRYAGVGHAAARVRTRWIWRCFGHILLVFFRHVSSMSANRFATDSLCGGVISSFTACRMTLRRLPGA